MALEQLDAFDCPRKALCRPDMRQTQVDMETGMDIAALTCKKPVDQIVRAAGDADFVPVAELARYESIDLIPDPMWQGIAPDLREHIGICSRCACDPSEQTHAWPWRSR